jgi:hypothetical protein
MGCPTRPFFAVGGELFHLDCSLGQLEPIRKSALEERADRRCDNFPFDP